MTSTDVLVLDTVAGPDVLGEIQRTLEHTWARHRHVPAEIRMTVATGVAEIGANIVKHAAAGQPVPVRMSVELLAHQVRVVFTDEGDPARVDLGAVRLPGASATHGRGLALASAVLEGLSYQRDGAVNQWTLTSRRFG